MPYARGVPRTRHPAHASRSERPLRVLPALEHAHRRERRVAEPTQRVPAAITGRERRGAVSREVERVDERYLIERHATRVLLLIVGEDDRPAVATRLEAPRDRGVAVGGMA